MTDTKLTPIWEDGCRHGRECFVGTVIYRDEKTDVYVYEDVSRGTIRACGRRGNEAHEYTSFYLLNEGLDMTDRDPAEVFAIGAIRERTRAKKEN